jgi:Arc/MetJ family transcription regulator
MRTTIVFDPELMSDALAASGARTQREAVELGLRTLIRLGLHAQLRRLRGSVSWQGDLNTLHSDRR